jgi:superkiller protein 3
VQGYSYAGCAFAQQGKYEEAEELLVESIDRGNRIGMMTQPKTFNALGLVKLNRNDFRGAQECFEQALILNPGDSYARYHLINALERQGKMEEAIEATKVLVDQKSDDHRLLVSLGKLLLRVDRVDEAIHHFLRAMELNPSCGKELYTEAFRLARMKKYGEAIRLLKAGLKITPHDTNILVPLVRLLAHSSDPGERDEAVSLGENAVKFTREKNPRVLFALAVAYSAVERKKEAIELASKALPIAERMGQTDLIREIQPFIQSIDTVAPPSTAPPDDRPADDSTL